MMAGFKGLNRFRTKAKKKADETLHKFVFESFSLLITNSPVLIGNFRANWFGSKLTPIVGDPKNFGLSADTGTIQASRTSNPGVSKGAPPTALERSNLGSAMTAKVGQDVYITNNLEYALPLENGHSDQAPAGVLHVSAQQMRARQ
jgi:hypothetical protein